MVIGQFSATCHHNSFLLGSWDIQVPMSPCHVATPQDQLNKRPPRGHAAVPTKWKEFLPLTVILMQENLLK